MKEIIIVTLFPHVPARDQPTSEAVIAPLETLSSPSLHMKWMGGGGCAIDIF